MVSLSSSSYYVFLAYSGVPLDLSGMNLADHPEPEENYLSKLHGRSSYVLDTYLIQCYYLSEFVATLLGILACGC